MPIRLLVSMTGDYQAMWGVRFLCDFFRNKENLACVLFHVAEENDASGEAAQDGEEILRKTKKFLVKRGARPENVTAVLQPRETGVAMDILEAGAEGGFDAVVLGRRGLNRLEELFAESAVSKLLEQHIPFPLWTCRKIAPPRHGVLACVDGSQESLRAAAHAARMIRDEPEHRAHVLHVARPPREGGPRPEAIIEAARAVLAQAGLPKDRVTHEVPTSSDVPGTILETAEKGRFAAVAVGRAGADKPPLRQIFAGSVSTKIVRSLTGAAAWLVP